MMFLKSASCRRISSEDYYNNNNNKCKEYYYKKGSSSSSSSSSLDEKNNKISSNSCSSGGNTILTVWRKSLLVSCSGFTVIDKKGNLVYRVDNYYGGRRSPIEIDLMDVTGKSILTMRPHKTVRLVDDWIIYNGEEDIHPNNNNNKTSQKKRQIGYVKKNASFFTDKSNNNNVIAQVYLLGTTKSYNKKPTYVIEGSYRQRSCKVSDVSSKTIVAEIKKKEAVNAGSASFGMDVFRLVVKPGFDAGFGMTLVLLLDQMYS